MAVIGKLVALLTAKTGDFVAGMRRGQGASRDLTVSMRAAGAAVTAFKGILAGVGIGMVVQGFRGLADQMDQTAKAARKLGISMEGLQKLRHAGGIAGGMDAGVVDNSIQKMLKGIEEAKEGRGTAAYALETLGLPPEILNGDAYDQLQLVADAMQRLESQAERVRVSMELFGRSGGDMVLMLQEGREGLEKFAEGASKWTEGQAAGMESFHDAIANIYAAGATGAAGVLTAPSEVWDLGKWMLGLDGATKAHTELTAAMREEKQAAEEAAAKMTRLNDAYEKLQRQRTRRGDAIAGGRELERELRASIDKVNGVTIDPNSIEGMDPRLAALKQLGAGRRGATGRGVMWQIEQLQEKLQKAQQLQSDLVEAKTIADAHLNPLEIYNREMERLNRLLSAGALAQEAYNRAASEAVKLRDREKLAAREALVQRGQQLAEANRTPMEQLRDKILDIRSMLRNGVIDLETAQRAAMQAGTSYASGIAKPHGFTFAASASAGSGEAYEAIARARFGGGLDPQEEIKQLTKQALQEAIRQSRIMEEIRDREEPQPAELPP